jgi:hypothetical protein
MVPKANRTERDQELPSRLLVQLSAPSSAYFTFKVIFFVRFPLSVFVE